MKHENHTGTSRPAPAASIMTAIVAALAMLAFSVNAQAQSCTIDNWDVAAGLSDANTGTQGSNNRRYGGPCGLRVAVDGTERFLTDDSPLAESTYIARFYAFLNNAGTGPILIFAADDGDDDVIQVWYENGDLTLTVFEAGGASHDATFAGIGNGWHSIELVWEASDAADNIRFALNTTDEQDDQVLTVDTSGVSIVQAHLGNVNGADTGGTMDFDDFDSRRISRPGRLLVGDATNSGSVTTSDVTALINEVFAGQYAPGQPDCTESGSITTSDVTCVINIVF